MMVESLSSTEYFCFFNSGPFRSSSLGPIYNLPKTALEFYCNIQHRENWYFSSCLLALLLTGGKYVWLIFFFNFLSSLNLFFYSLLAWMLFSEKFIDRLTEVLLYGMCNLYFVALKIVLEFDFWEFDCYVAL